MNRPLIVSCCALALLATLLPDASATPAVGIDAAGMFRNHGFEQTSNTQVTERYAFWTADVTAAAGTAFTSADLLYPPGVSEPMPDAGGNQFHLASPSFGSLALMNSTARTGTYFFSLSDGQGGQATTSIVYGADNYAVAPMLTGSSWSALQHMNASQAITVSVSPLDYTGTDEAWVFFGIYRRSDGAQMFNQGFQPAGTSSFQISAGLLSPNTEYFFDLDHSRRSFQYNFDTTFPNMLAFESRTFGNFTTAPVPEPGTYGLMALGLLCLAGAARRRG